MELPSPLPVVFAIWVFCFGEMIATSYQSEADRLGILWLASVKPRQLALGKFLAYLPLVLPAWGSAGIVIFLSGGSGVPALLVFLFTFLGAAAGIALCLAPAALSMNQVFYHSGSVYDMTMEQVPITLPSILSAVVLIGFLAGFCCLEIRIRGSTITPLASTAAILAGCGLLTVLAISAAALLLKRRYLL